MRQPLDVEAQYRQILCFWKEDWDYEHCHNFILNPRVTHPTVVLRAKDEHCHDFYELISKFIKRLRTDNEDETNLKIRVEEYCEKLEGNSRLVAERATTQLN